MCVLRVQAIWATQSATEKDWIVNFVQSVTYFERSYEFSALSLTTSLAFSLDSVELHCTVLPYSVLFSP